MNPEEFMNQVVPKELTPEEAKAIKESLGRAVKKPQVHNPYKNQANFLNSARRPQGVMPEVIGKKSYPANHPLAIEALDKAKEKRERKHTDKQLIKAFQAK